MTWPFPDNPCPACWWPWPEADHCPKCKASWTVDPRPSYTRDRGKGAQGD